jgi:hypothetical protein
MQLVLFGEFAQHVARLARVLRQPRGSALLLGAGGSGKGSVARLACHVSDTQLCTLEITKAYGLPEFRWAGWLAGWLVGQAAGWPPTGAACTASSRGAAAIDSRGRWLPGRWVQADSRLAQQQLVLWRRADVKKAWLRAGVEGRHVALLVADSQLTDEAFVEDLAGLLSSGEVRTRVV